MTDKKTILELLDDAAEKCRAEGAAPHSRRFRLPNDYIANLCEAAAKHIRCCDDSIDYLENSISAHEENNVKICSENRALMRYFNSVENALESDGHDDWNEYQAAKSAVLGLSMVMLRSGFDKDNPPVPWNDLIESGVLPESQGVVNKETCQHGQINHGQCQNCGELMAGQVIDEQN